MEVFMEAVTGATVRKTTFHVCNIEQTRQMPIRYPRARLGNKELPVLIL